MSGAASPSDPLGYDVWVREDIDPSGRSASGIELVQNAIYHRVTTDQLLLVGSDGDGFVDYGRDVRRWVGEPMTQDIANARGPELVIVIQRDPRILASSIVVEIDVERVRAGYDFEIRISCRTITGQTISMILGVSAVTVELLSQGR